MPRRYGWLVGAAALWLGACVPGVCGGEAPESGPSSSSSEAPSRRGEREQTAGKPDERKGEQSDETPEVPEGASFDRALSTAEWGQAYRALRGAYRDAAEAHRTATGATDSSAQLTTIGYQMSWMAEHHPLVSGPKKLPRSGRPDHPLFGRRPMWSHYESGISAWHRRLAERHEEWSRESESDDLSTRHADFTERHAAMADAVAVDEEIDDPGPPAQREVEGRNVYVRACATCHAPDGSGVAKAFPPLKGHPVATGAPREAARAVLEGVEGPTTVRGEEYAGVMPGYADRLTDRQIAAVLTYVRSTWRNEASDISEEQVAEWREEFAGEEK